jgi:hypothetical protein
MTPVEEFYQQIQAEADAAAVIVNKRGRKVSDKQYFTITTERAIVAYNKETDQYLRNKIYREYIDYPFNKLVENIYHTFKFSYFDIPYEDIKCEVVAFLNEKIHKFTEGKGKAFSYFSIVAKNYLIIQNNTNYAKFKRKVDTSLIDESRDLMSEVSISSYQESLKDFVDLWADWYDKNATAIFSTRKDLIVADTVLELFRIRENIEDFNKKALYILVRERTGLKTQNITKVLTVMRNDFVKMFSVYQKTGRFNDNKL